MNIYFLVEGKSTEKKIYSKWLQHLIPELEQVKYHDEVKNNNYYLISGKGYPRILDDALDNAADKIRETLKYDYLVVCVDADEESVEERVHYIHDVIREKELNLGKTKVEVVVQNRCIETWLLGNRNIFHSRQSLLEGKLPEYVKYYDVSQNNPEGMGKYNEKNHADFHLKYLQEIFRSKNTAYTKKYPRDAAEKYYLEQLQKRVQEKPEDLKTFQVFLKFCEIVRNNIIQNIE